jgi:predicted RND superfamily exporter protein
MLLPLPVVWAWSERRGRLGQGSTADAERLTGRTPSTLATLPTRALARASRISARSPRIVFGACAAVVAAAALLAGRFHYETNLERVFSRDIDAVDVAHEVRRSFGVDPQPWLAVARSPEEAARIAASFEASDAFARATVEPMPDGRLQVQAFARELSLDSARAAEQRRIAQSIHPEATSMAALFEALIGTDRPWMLRLTALVAMFVAGLLIVDLRSLRLAVTALVPVAVGSLAAFALLCAADFAWNTVTLVGLPLLLGLGVDDGIHLAHRIREEPGRPVDEIVASVGPAIALTTATTCASAATLLWSRHPGIESLAVLLLVGLPACLLASVTVLPAAATALGVARVDRGRGSGE